MSPSFLWFMFVLVVAIAVNCERLSEALVRFGIDVEEMRRELQTINHDDDLFSSTPYKMSVCTASSENTCGSGTCCYYYRTQDDDFFDYWHYHENCEVRPGSGFTGTCTWYQTGVNTYVCTTNYNSCINPTSQPTSQPTRQPSRQPSSQPTRQPTSQPTRQPSSQPTSQPTRQPSKQPSSQPTRQPTNPTSQPTGQPSTTPTSKPTPQPTTIPTARPTNSKPPSLAPQIAPTSYPTYTSSVTVYFVVSQVLSGISASNYSSSRETNDAVFKHVVVSMLGYDSELDDISIQTVTDISAAPSSRLLTAATIETEVVYTITTPTSIFNDTNMATAQFIRALNETIATGAFDRFLRGMGSTEWQSVTTEYVIFSTASPTSSPTPSSTIILSQKDEVDANLLDAQIDGKVFKAKIQYYLGAFVNYFLSIYVLLYLYSYLQYGKMTARKLYDASYQSEAYIRHTTTNMNNKCNTPILSDVYANNVVVHSTIKMKKELQLMTLRESRSECLNESTSSINLSNSACLSLGGKDSIVCTLDSKNKYSKGYREYVQQNRTLLCCSPILYPGGYVIKVPCTSAQVCLPPGRVEDILLFLCHNHPLFSCFYFMDGSKLGAHGTRILYIGKDIAVFVLYQFSNMLLQYFMLENRGLGTIINLFVITPSAVSIGLLLKYLYTCPFTETVEFQHRYAKYESIILFLGRLAIVPIMLIMCGSLIIACLFSSNRHILMILINYFIYVQLYGILLAVVNSLLLFVDNFYFKVSIFGLFEVVCIGNLFKERIMAERLVVDVDYSYRIYNYLFGLITVQKILCREDAIEAKWIIGTGNEGEYDIEINGVAALPFIVTNPLIKETQRNTALINIDGNHSASNEDGVGGIIVAEEKSQIECPIIPTAVGIDNPKNYMSNDQQVEINCAATVMDEDILLYQEYKNLQSQCDDAVYKMPGDDTEVAITFDEWKIGKKQFKQGSRGSFVKELQVFEEREQKISDNFNQSASVKNTMHLYSSKVKIVLAATNASNRPK